MTRVTSHKLFLKETKCPRSRTIIVSCSRPHLLAYTYMEVVEGHDRIATFFMYHHHHQVPDLEQTLAAMPLQTSLSSDNFKKFKPLLCPPVAELQRLSRNVILCLPLSRLPSTFPVKDKNSKPLRLHTCPKNSICLLFSTVIFEHSPLSIHLYWGFFSVHEILNILYV